VERLPVDICEVCGEDLVVAVDENGWPSLENAQDFMDEHAHCLRARAPDNWAPAET
jgi:hypothetical protein